LIVQKKCNFTSKYGIKLSRKFEGGLKYMRPSLVYTDVVTIGMHRFLERTPKN